MQSNKKIIELGKKMPRGAKKQIAKKAGLSYNTVNNYFKGQPVTYNTEVKILKESKIVLDLVDRVEQTRNELMSYFI